MADVKQDELADEIAEAISDTLDMDWQPSWAAPNIIAIINREREAAFKAGEDAERARVVAWLRRLAGDEGQTFQSRNLAAQIAAMNFANAIERREHRENRNDQNRPNRCYPARARRGD